MANPEGWKVGERSPNQNLKEIEQRALEAIMKRKQEQAIAARSVSIQKVVWANELTLEIGVQMVGDVRADVEANILGCSVCYLIAGEVNMSHKAGINCTKLPLVNETAGWLAFKNDLKFREGILCYYCLLPTVSVSSSRV